MGASISKRIIGRSIAPKQVTSILYREKGATEFERVRGDSVSI